MRKISVNNKLVIAGFVVVVFCSGVLFSTRIAHTQAQQPGAPALRSELTFEHLQNQWGPRLRRAKIPGGWLVATGNDENGSVAFVPDEKHSWTGGGVP